MSDAFRYDVFLSHSAKDREVVSAVAERLRLDGLRIWLDDWEIRRDDSVSEIMARTEEGLEQSRALVLFMSSNAFGPEWPLLEAGTLRFRDPLNKERRFIPLRLDEARVIGSLAQSLSIRWLPEDREGEYAKLLEACRPPLKETATEAQAAEAETAIQLESNAMVLAYAFDLDGKRTLTGGADDAVRLWDLETGECLRVMAGHRGRIWSLAWTHGERHAISCSSDMTLRLWDVETGQCLRVLEGHTASVYGVAVSADQLRVLSGAEDGTVRLWDLTTGECLRVLEGHKSEVWSVAWTADQRHALSGSADRTVRLWDLETGRCVRVLEGHTGAVDCVAHNAHRAISGSDDQTVRVWEPETQRCLYVLEGHTHIVMSVAWIPEQGRALSGSHDKTVRLWDVETGRCLRILRGHPGKVRTVTWNAARRKALSGDETGDIREWALSDLAEEGSASVEAVSTLPALQQVQYTNAKVLLVGESGVGKTGLSQRLALNSWQPSDSTVGAWATQWKLPAFARDGVEREIWLWDFGGQADQRLIHQLYMDETALAVLVFDGQKEELFETLGQWDRDLTRASRKEFSKLLVAGRVDAGDLRSSRNQVEAFAKERNYSQFIETSAKANLCCEELRQAIVDGIRWENIPWRSSPLLFKRLKDEIVRLKDAGQALMRFNELRETLTLRMSGEGAPFSDDELKAVIGLLAGPGVVWELTFGSWVLLQPERINAYAQAVIQTMRADEYDRGCIPEERVLNGDLTYHASTARLDPDEERFVLLAMHQTLVQRDLCLREHTGQGTLLIFPTYYRRERPELVGQPPALVSYRFSGFLDEIYATLVVRLHHTEPFKQDQLWCDAADFKTLTGRKLGVKLIRRGQGEGELELYFDSAIPVEEKIIFSKYVHEHLLQNARDVVRLRHYVCPLCGTPVGNREVAVKRLEKGQHDILCVNCEKRMPLWDEMEELFASPAMKDRVRELQEQSAFVLDNESKERALVGEVISTAALAGQISRELTVSDHGIDMEIEFKSDAGEATGRKLYLQLKSGASYLRKRRSDGAEIFTLKKERHGRYWMAQKFPVFLVIRNADGEVRWMDVRDYLERMTRNGRKLLKQIVFEGSRFDVMSVRRLRDKVLS